MEKKLPETLAALLTKENVKGRHIRLMFQDEARFGRMVRIRRCWAPHPLRPSVPNGYEREFVYVYGAVSPIEGDMDWMISPNMNTEQMNTFLSHILTAHQNEFIIMVLDGASSHKSKDLQKYENIRFIPLPSYSPELNPQEHIWDELREKEFPNRVFNNMDAVKQQLQNGLKKLSEDHIRVKSITGWPWIVSLNLKAN